ncbi:MAG: zinc ribbon domain-containing protein [Lachnospiraceae bacterium]|nr:zinc ribbon domain-containing protein [Lachnospiraceae bacterium]
MFCVHCGAENEDGVKFCVNCGKPMEDMAPSKPVKEKKPVNKKALTIGIVSSLVVVIGLVVGGLIWNNAVSTIDLNKFTTVEASGFDGYGTPSYSIDWDAISEKYGKKVTYNAAAKKEMGGFLNLIDPIDALQDYISVKFDKNTDLKNGDMVEYEFVIDEDAKKYINYKVKKKNAKYMVGGLEKIKEFDPFDSFEITFNGTSPDGSLVYNYNASNLNYYDFSVDKTSGLKNGDVVKVTIDKNAVENCVRYFGMKATATEKEYTVSGLSEYMTSFADLSSGLKDKLKDAAKKVINDYVSGSYSAASKLSGLDYAGYLELVSNNTPDTVYYQQNGLYLVFSGIVSTTDGGFPDHRVYFPVQFSDVVVSGTEVSYSGTPSIAGYSSLGTSYSTKGFVNPTELLESFAPDTTYFNQGMGDGIEVFEKPERIEKLEDLPEALKTYVQEAVKIRIQNYAAEYYKDKYTLSELKLTGEYVLAREGEYNYSNANFYIPVFEGTVHSINNEFEDLTVYYAYYANGLFKYGNGDYVYTDISSVSDGYFYFPGVWDGSCGYVDGAKLYENFGGLPGYTCVYSEGLKQFVPESEQTDDEGGAEKPEASDKADDDKTETDKTEADKTGETDKENTENKNNSKSDT